MRIQYPRLAASLLGFMTSLSGCDALEEKKIQQQQQQQLEVLCTAGCRAELCFADLPEDFPVVECITTCRDVRQPEAESISTECGEAHKVLLSCLGDRDCHEELLPWWEQRETAEDDIVCSSETVMFRQLCPGIWFAPE